MVVVMKERASDAQVEKVIAHLVELGMDVHRSSGASRTVLGVVGSGKVDPRLIEMLDGVRDQAATQAVVQSAIMILVLDAFWAVVWLLGKGR